MISSILDTFIEIFGLEYFSFKYFLNTLVTPEVVERPLSLPRVKWEDHVNIERNSTLVMFSSPCKVKASFKKSMKKVASSMSSFVLMSI